MRKILNNKILILFTGIGGIGGIQQYNQHLQNAFLKEFSQNTFVFLNIFERYRQKMLFLFKFFKEIFFTKPDFLICGHINLVPLAYLFKKFYHIRYAVLIHGIEVWNLKRGLKYSGLKNADIIITVSHYTKVEVIQNDIDEKKITVLPDSVDTSLFYPKPKDENLCTELGLRGKCLLLTVSRIFSQERYKGHDIMLSVMQKLDDRYVWLVVGDGDDVVRLQRKAKDLGILRKIRFLGRIEHYRLVDYYNLCDCYIMPSKGEGFGIVFLEAMACGKPVVAGNKDGSTEPLMNGRLGFAVKPDDLEEISDAIEKACTGKEDRTNPEYLRKAVETNFGIESFNRKVKEIFGKYIVK